MRNSRWIMLISCLGMTLTCEAEGEMAMLRINPFLQPIDLSLAADKSGRGDERQSVTMNLRATMVAGNASQANIGGEIIGLGEDVNGYRLAEVYSRYVVLDRDGIRKELRIEDGDGKDRN